ALVTLLEHYKQDRQPGEGFGDYCQRLGAEKLRALLPAPAKAGHSTPAPKKNGHGAKPVSGNGHPPARFATAALATPDTQVIPVELPAVEVKAEEVALASPFKESETFLAGLPGEEMRDHTVRYNSDGSVRETVVYFYGADQRAATARGGDPLRREAAYLGRVDPVRLHSARKLRDTYYVGPAGHERRDRGVEYTAEIGR